MSRFPLLSRINEFHLKHVSHSCKAKSRNLAENQTHENERMESLDPNRLSLLRSRYFATSLNVRSLIHTCTWNICIHRWTHWLVTNGEKKTANASRSFRQTYTRVHFLFPHQQFFANDALVFFVSAERMKSGSDLLSLCSFFLNLLKSSNL